MTNVILFHSALGLRPSLKRLAARLEAAGHEVVTPDLYDGRVFEALEDGAAYRDELGVPELLARAEAATALLPPDLVYVGLSMGAAAATYLALTRPGARGLVLLHGAMPPQAMGVDRWPHGLPVLLHRSADDRWVDPGHLAAFREAVPAALLQEHVHPGAGHLFTDEDGPEYDVEASEAVVRSLLRFVASR